MCLRVLYYIPGEQQGGVCAQRADEMDGQFSSLVVGESEASLDMFQGVDELRSSPAGVHALAEHQLVPNVSAGVDKWRGVWLMLRGLRNGRVCEKIHTTLPPLRRNMVSRVAERQTIIARGELTVQTRSGCIYTLHSHPFSLSAY